MTQELFSLQASGPRRVFGVGTLLVLGGVTAFLALGRSHDSLFWQFALLGFGLLVLYLAERMRRATALQLQLTDTALTDSDGRVLAQLDQIERVERGSFAIKPSNGFMIVLKSPGPAVWAPGIWWRLGRRVGVGGVTGAAQTKALAQILEAQISS